MVHGSRAGACFGAAGAAAPLMMISAMPDRKIRRLIVIRSHQCGNASAPVSGARSQVRRISGLGWSRSAAKGFKPLNRCALWHDKRKAGTNSGGGQEFPMSSIAVAPEMPQRSRVIAGLLSLIAPGVGHLYI